MYLMHSLSLVVLAVTWVFAWRVGCRWCQACGIEERASRWALGSILPTAGLVLSIHVLAFVSLFSGRRLIIPEAVAVVYLVIAGGARYLTSECQPAPSTPHDSSAGSKMFGKVGALWLPIVIIAALYTVFLIEALTRYPTGYDGLHYHLPLAVRWMRAGSIDLIYGYMHGSVPDNAMLVPLLLAFAKLERLITLFNVPNVLLLAAVIYGLARALDAGRNAALAAVCVTLSIPIVVFQSFSSYVDLYGAVAWLTSLLALTWAARVDDHRARRGLIVLAALAAGVALGSKSTYLVIVALLVPIAAAVEWIHREDNLNRWRRAACHAGLFAAIALGCSSFWFVRGIVQAGNPVYPVAIQAGDTEILPGFSADDFFPRRDLATEVKNWWHYPWTEEKRSGSGETYSVNNGLGAAYAALVPVGVLAAIAGVLRTGLRDPAAKWRLVYLLLAVTAGALLLTAFHEVLRYVLPQILIAVPLAGALVDRMLTVARRWTIGILTIALAATAAAAGLSPARAFLGRIRDDAWTRSTFYQIPALIDDFAPGARVLNLAPPSFTYPLLGRHLANEVISGPHWAVMLAGQPISAAALHEHRIDYIFVREPCPADWPDDLSVEMVYDDSAVRVLPTTPATRVYRVLPARSH
ncbi:MAG: hypothetical protein KJ749_07145 [Planctomycetes bacterium]|nr:hypothetical protein [Planctomycetota bacterium]